MTIATVVRTLRTILTVRRRTEPYCQQPYYQVLRSGRCRLDEVNYRTGVPRI